SDLYVRSPDGTKIAYEWTERESADTTAVFIHGFAESQAAWLDVHSRWAHSCSVLTVDLRGHGDSGISRSGVYSVSEYVEDVLAAVKAMGGKKQVFIGHSLGGWVASTLAAQSQQSTVGLLLVDISPESTERSQATIFGGLRERMRPYSTEADYEDHLRATRPLVSQKNLEY